MNDETQGESRFRSIPGIDIPHQNSFPIQTARLVLTPICDEDGEFLVRLLNDPDFIRFIGNRNVLTVPQAKKYIQKPIKDFVNHGIGLFVVTKLDDRETIGIVSLLKRDKLADHDIGFAFLPNFRGAGFAFEATSAILDYANHKLELPRMAAVTNQDNRKSIALLERLGLVFQSMIEFEPGAPASRLYLIDFQTLGIHSQ